MLMWLSVFAGAVMVQAFAWALLFLRPMSSIRKAPRRARRSAGLFFAKTPMGPGAKRYPSCRAKDQSAKATATPATTAIKACETATAALKQAS